MTFGPYSASSGTRLRGLGTGDGENTTWQGFSQEVIQVNVIKVLGVRTHAKAGLCKG